MDPSASALRYGGKSAKPCVVCPSKSPSSKTSATTRARSGARPDAASSASPKRNRSEARNLLEIEDEDLFISSCETPEHSYQTLFQVKQSLICEVRVRVQINLHGFA